MFAKRLLQKAVLHSQKNVQHSSLTAEDLDIRVTTHYGIPSTACILAFDPVQRLLAIGTLDGRIKLIGGDCIEAFLTSPKQSPYKKLEFLQNQGYLVSISNDNDIQVWNLESRCLACCLQWEYNITAFSIISGSSFMLVGDEYGSISVVKYNAEDEKLLQTLYHIPEDSISEAAGFSFPIDQLIVGILHQPSSYGNRILIAYANGLLVLWDASERQVKFVGGGKDLELKDEVVNSLSKSDTDLIEGISETHLGEKEISALCWASSNGSILAVGYTDGDILFWKMSSASKKGQQSSVSSKSVVKLQLSSAERRLPVIVLHWLANQKARNDCDGQLFIYGGDEIGSEELITVLTIEWSSKLEILSCIGRADFSLNGSFADMILLPVLSAVGANSKADLVILTSPGQLHFYDDISLSTILSKTEIKSPISPMEFPAMMLTADPCMTAAKLSKLPAGGNSAKALAELASIKLGSRPTAATGGKWPLTGGVLSRLSIKKDTGIERIYLAGYMDGSLRMWDATYPTFSFICLLKGEVEGIKVGGSSAPVSKFDICFTTFRLAVGNECGLVRIYNFQGIMEESNFDFVTETKREVHNFPQGKGPCCRAIFSLVNSPVQALRFTNCGAKLGIGFGCGRIAVLDMNSFSVLFFTEAVPNSSSPVISLIWKELTHAPNPVKSPKNSGTKSSAKTTEEVIFVLTKDAKINVLNGSSGNMIGSQPFHLKNESVAISMYVLESVTSVSGLSDEKHVKESFLGAAARNEPTPESEPTGTDLDDSENLSPSETGESLLDSLILLCCEDSLRLYSTKAVIQGNYKSIFKVKYSKCRWTTTFEKNERVCGLVLMFQTGVIELRSLPTLELVKESSLMSALRWNFKENADKTISSSGNGQIVVANGRELAFLSLLASENDFRIPESLPCLHDEVLAAAADAAINFSQNQRKKQNIVPGILGGIVRGLKGGKTAHDVEVDAISQSNYSHFESILVKPSVSESHSPSIDNKEVVELSIDDIDLDEEPPQVASTSSSDKNMPRDNNTEREKLFEGGTNEWKPKKRTPEEIMATYRKAGDASSAAVNARNKLMERQEKLERISKRTEDLRNGAEDFASLANELVKTMESRRKWWHI